jgi:ubiquinone biosynthesis protein COQ9
VNPKKAAIINHAMSVILFYLNDHSDESQDTDAFIEKTTDLLFKLSDTSTLTSMFDLGKFLIQRKQTGFSWE